MSRPFMAMRCTIDGLSFPWTPAFKICPVCGEATNPVEVKNEHGDDRVLTPEEIHDLTVEAAAKREAEATILAAELAAERRVANAAAAAIHYDADRWLEAEDLDAWVRGR